MKPAKLQKQLEGIVGISITPMTSTKEIDEKGVRAHLNFMVDNGINGERGVIVTTGSTGECGALNLEERKKVLEIAIDEVGDKVPIVAGCNHSDIYQTIELSKHAEKVGAAGIMILSPYYYVPTDDVIKEFYQEVSKHIDLGIMLYNNFEVTHKDIATEVLGELAESSNVVGIKECTPNFVKMEQVARKLGDKMTIINGHGEFLEPYAALAGTKGFISSTSNFAPGLTVEMWEARSNGNYEEAAKIRKKLTPYLDLAQKFGAIGGEPKVLSVIKKATDLVGSSAGVGRLPLRELSLEEENELKAQLKNMKLI